MGFESAIFRGHRADADEIVEDFDEEEFPSVVLGAIGEVEVRQLAAILLELDGDATSNLVADEGTAMIAEASEDGPWLADLPSGMVEVLARSSAEEIARVAGAWAPLLQTKHVDANRIVSSLAQLARETQPGENLLLWMRT